MRNGTLAADIGPFNTGVIGDAVMTPFQASSDTHGLYDSSTGIRLSDTADIIRWILDPSGPCMCYSLASLNGVQANACMTWDYFGATPDIVEAGQLGDKGLLQCDSIDITLVDSSSAAAETQTYAQGVEPTAISTATGTSSGGGSNTAEPNFTVSTVILFGGQRFHFSDASRDLQDYSHDCEYEDA
ncbi:hypothetical protein FRB96_007424 [Tulasnella sp. 330]|nr:hypothetical protein FRB96_007424 [Tulasnella sp. 330]KAG8876654.1 hypothetical protein FRB98_007088 [Tulasnella sp. 332]